MAFRHYLQLKLPAVLFLVIVLLSLSVKGIAQKSTGFLSGIVTDGSTGLPMFGAQVRVDSSSIQTTSDPNGIYLTALKSGVFSISFHQAGFQDKKVSGIRISSGSGFQFNIILYPLGVTSMSGRISRDSVPANDSAIHVLFAQESRLAIYHPILQSSHPADLIQNDQIQTGNDKDGMQLLQRLGGVLPEQNPGRSNLQSVNIFGLGYRYNQVLYNGTVLNSFSTDGKFYPFNALPVEMIQSVAVRTIPGASIPGDVAGGTIEIITKDSPERNFFYLRGGAGVPDGSEGRNFLGDGKGDLDFLALPGSGKHLPAGFPTSRTVSQFDQKNPQEQVYLAKQLKNNLAPDNTGHSPRQENVTLGFGRIIRLKPKAQIGILGYLKQEQAEQIDEASVQVAPNLIGNPFPFAQQQILIRSQSTDLSFRYSSRLTAMLNTSILFGRNKVRLKTIFSSQLDKKFIERTSLSKPDEDPLAGFGLGYKIEQRKFLRLQLSGEHALGKSNKFKLDWQATYDYINQQTPDERNFLLRKDSLDNSKFEIAQQSSASLASADAMFTNSSRLWSSLREHHFNGMVNVLVPFNLLHHPQVLSGGIYVAAGNRIFFSDLFLVRGKGFYPVNDLLATERYFPGGLNIQNYYTNVRIVPGGNYVLNATNRGNYTASTNLGASFLQLDGRLTRDLSLLAGLRLESASQLVSNTQYNYFAGYRNPQLGTLDENTKVNNLDILPSLQLTYQPLKKLTAHAAYFRSVNRPAPEELSLFRSYDPALFIVHTGNQLLERSVIDNFDAGISWFANATNSVSISGFYKKLYQPIENIVSAYSNATGNLASIPFNMPEGEIHGLMGSVKLNLNFIGGAPWLSGLSFFGTGTWLRSKVDGGPVKSAATPFVPEHTLSGSPDYTINAGMVFNYRHLPHLTVLYKRSGDYISSVGSGQVFQLENGNRVSAIPDYRVKERAQLDLQIGQNFFSERLQLVAGVNNISKQPFIQYQDLNGNKHFDRALLVEKNVGPRNGFYLDGIDNTVAAIQSQRIYYCTISYLF